MTVSPAIPDYKDTLISNLKELSEELRWCFKNPQKVSHDKILDIKRGVKNLKYFTVEKIKEEKFVRDMERFDVLINSLPEVLSDVEKTTINTIFERIEKLIHDLG